MIKTKAEDSSIEPDLQITDDQISEIAQKYVESYPSEKSFEGLTEEEQWSSDQSIDNILP